MKCSLLIPSTSFYDTVIGLVKGVDGKTYFCAGTVVAAVENIH